MKSLLETLGRRGLFLFDPETAHGLSIKALKAFARRLTKRTLSARS